MAPIAILFGVLLTLLGGGMYVYTDMVSMTALIPAFFGLPLIVLGAIAMNESARKHAMHLAAMVGLLGFVLPLGRVIYASIQNGFVLDTKSGSALAMAGLCGIFVAWCVKSFIDARIARKQSEAQTPAQ
jgi:ABC-type uncharacterized transport system permease subunit